MYRRVIALCVSGIALATTAYAATPNYDTWGVTSAVSPPGSATISPTPGQNGYSQFSNTPSAAYTIMGATGYTLKTVMVDGRAVNIKNGNPNYPSSFAYTYNNDRFLHTLKVITVPNKYDFTLTKTNNGDGNATGAFSPAKVTNVTYGTKNKTITVIPTKGSIITNVADSGGIAPQMYVVQKGQPDAPLTSFADVANGQSVKVVYASVDAPHALIATFAKIRGVTAVIGKSYPTAPLNMTNGSVTVALDGRQSTSKSGAITYAWSANPAAGCSFSAGTAAKTNVTFTQGGTYVVSLTAYDGSVASTPATVTLTVNQPGVTTSGRCVNCHNQTTVVAPYEASSHVANNGATCSYCHGDHATRTNSGTAYVNTKCQNCHSEAAEFASSKHWNNSFEYDPGFAGGAVAGQIDPNNSYTTTENGALTTCAYRCHFKPGMGPQSNVTGLLADGHSTTYVTYTDANGTTYSRPGGDGCMACHDAHGLAATARSTCYTCHTGGKHGWSVADFEKSTHFTSTYAIADGIGGPTGKACIACHDPHSLDAPFFAMSTATQIKKGVGCQSCHTPGAPYSVYNADGTGKAPHFPNTVNSWDTAATAYYTGTGATCAECHSHNNTINAGWAEGGHGDVTAVPWKGDSGHTDWGAQGSNGVNFQSSPQATNCIRCHSAKGFAAFVDSGFTKIDKLPASQLAAPLTCSACHDSVDKGTLRLANFTTASHGAKGFKAYWGYSTASFVKNKVVTAIQLGDNRNSNICMPCHSQRASGQEIKDVFAAAKPAIAPGVAGSGIGTAIYPHAAQPGAIFYGKGGYEFTATNGTGASNSFAYQDRARHQRIGNYLPSGYNDTGVTQGSCVGCHMTSPDTHNVEVVTKDSNGNLTGIVSTECAKCHPAEFTYQDLQAKKDELAALATALGNLLVKKGITLDGVNPLPERTSNFDMSLGTGDLVKAEKNTGAWFNWYLFKTADPGAYAHNPSYARRLLTDSIDWMDDNSLNSSAASTVLAMGVNGNALYNSAVDVNKALAFTNDPGCLGCHLGSGTNSNAAPGIEAAPHYNTAGTLVPGQTFTQAQFVVPGTQCNYCHGYGHGTDSPGSTVLNQYAESAHGDVKGMAWTDYDFKTRATCNACHTTQGFVTAIGNNWSNTAAFGVAGDNAKQVLGCNTCHSSTAWKSYSTASGKLSSSIRVISGGYTAGMGGYGSAAKATVKFSDQGESNICIPCHATRENGDSLKAGTGTVASPIPYNFANKSFVNPHYLGSAAVWQGTAGFKFYTSTTRYAVNKPTHGVATPDIQTPNHSFNSRMTTQQQQKGSCVACHMGLTNSHTFDTYSTATRFQFNTGAQVNGCLGCHSNTSGGKGRYYLAPTAASSGGYALDRSIDFLTWQFAQVGIYFNNNGAGGTYFFTDTNYTTGVTNWTTQPAFWDNVGIQTAQQLGLQTMGAAMNLKILATDHGAAAHNAAWTKAVISDSLVYLQHGNVGDRSSTASINNISFSAYSTAVTPVGGGMPIDGKPCSISNLKSFLTSSGKRR